MLYGNSRRCFISEGLLCLVLEVEQPAYVGVLDPAYAGLCRTNHTLQNAF